MDVQRKLMSEALDGWFMENSEVYLSVSALREGVTFKTITPLGKGNRVWGVDVDGEAGGVGFRGAFKLWQDKNSYTYNVGAEELVRIDNTAMRQVAEKSALVTSNKSGIPKGDKARNLSEAYTEVTGGRAQLLNELDTFGQKLTEWYTAKPGTVLDELIANLRCPTNGDPLSSLSGIATALTSNSNIRDALPDSSPMELLVLRGWTQTPIDVDRDMGFPDTPPFPTAADSDATKSARRKYTKTYTSHLWETASPDGEKYRNGSLHKAISSAMHDQSPGGTCSPWSEQIIRKWIKWICTLSACAASDDLPHKETLWCGFGGGGLSAVTVDKHRDLKPDDLLGLPLPLSASFNEDSTKEYAYGKAVNSDGEPNETKPGTMLFSISNAHALPLQAVSQYPTEEEVLLPPLSVFTVSSVKDYEDNQFSCGLEVELECLGPLSGSLSETPWLANFFDTVHADALQASRMLKEHTARLDLKIQDKLEDSLLTSMKDQLQLERSKKEVLRRELSSEATELRKQTALAKKWEKKYQREKAEHDALIANMNEEAKNTAKAKLDYDQAEHDSQAHYNEMKTNVEKAVREKKQLKADLDKTKVTLSDLSRKAESEKKRHKERTTVFETRIASLEKEKQELAELGRDQGNELHMWKRKCDEAHTQSVAAGMDTESRYAKRLAELSEEVRELTKALNVEKNLKEKEIKENARTQQHLATKTTETDRLKERVQEERTKHKEETSSMFAKLVKAETSAEECKNAKEDALAEVVRHKKSVEREASTVEELRRKIDEASLQNIIENEALRDTIREETLIKKKALSDLARYKEQYIVENRECEDLKKRVDKFNELALKAQEEKRQDVQRLERNITHMKEDWNTTEHALLKEISDAKASESRLEGKIRSSAEEWKRKQDLDTQAASAMKAAMEEEVERREVEIERLKKKIEALNEEVSNQMKKAELDKQTFATMARQQEGVVQDVTDTNRDLQKTLLKQRTTLEDAKKDCDRFEAKIYELQESIRHGRDRERSLAEETGRLRGDVEEREREAGKAEREHRACMERLNRQMEVLRNEAKRYAEQATLEKRETARLREELTFALREVDTAKRAANSAEYESFARKESLARTPQRSLPTTPLTPPFTSSSYSVASPTPSCEPSPALQRLEATTRRLRREMDTIKGALPASHLRSSP